MSLSCGDTNAARRLALAVSDRPGRDAVTVPGCDGRSIPRREAALENSSGSWSMVCLGCSSKSESGSSSSYTRLSSASSYSCQSLAKENLGLRRLGDRCLGDGEERRLGDGEERRLGDGDWRRDEKRRRPLSGDDEEEELDLEAEREELVVESERFPAATAPWSWHWEDSGATNLRRSSRSSLGRARQAEQEASSPRWELPRQKKHLSWRSFL